jgi:hypothetical protein
MPSHVTVTNVYIALTFTEKYHYRISCLLIYTRAILRQWKTENKEVKRRFTGRI